MNIITLPLGMLQANCYLVCDEDAKVCAVIDPGAVGHKVAQKAAELGCTIGAVFLTHAHFDHVGGTKALHQDFPDLPIYLHPGDADEGHNMSHGNLVYTHTYREGDVLRVGGLEFAVLSTPGHSPGSVCLACGDHIFSGDTLFEGSCGRTDFEGGSVEQMMASLKRLALLPGDPAVYPGHGPATTLQTERLFNPYVKEAMRR